MGRSTDVPRYDGDGHGQLDFSFFFRGDCTVCRNPARFFSIKEHIRWYQEQITDCLLIRMANGARMRIRDSVRK